MRLYSYILTHDTGFAPNPFHGVLTLACCKPAIRRSAQVGDAVVGLTPKRLGHRLVYAMLVGARLTFAEYWADQRFRAKRPVWRAPREVRHGDNCYEPLPGGAWRQLRCRHSKADGTEDAKLKRRDLGGRYVLIAERWWYFGDAARALPRSLSFVVAGRGHAVTEQPRRVRAVLRFVNAMEPGLSAEPREWAPSAGALPVGPGRKPASAAIRGRCSR